MRYLLTIALMIPLLVNGQDHFLIAKTTSLYKLHDSTDVRIFNFNHRLADPSVIPSPTLYGVEGDTMRITLWNVSQGAPHTIHPHGLDVDQANDGVPHLSFIVGHMDSATYEFVAPHAGTYLYHCHVVSTIHVQAGMYGVIIIRPPSGDSMVTWDGGYSYQQERTWLFSELDKNWHVDSVLAHNHDTSMPMMPVWIPNYDPTYFMLNGQTNTTHTVSSNPNIAFSAGDTAYLRLVNVGNMANRVTFPASFNARIVSTDGRPMTPDTTDVVTILPGERYGVLVNPPELFGGVVTVDYLDLNNLDVVGSKQIEIAAANGISDALSFPFSWQIVENPAFKPRILLQGTGQEVEVTILSLEGLVGPSERIIANKNTVWSDPMRRMLPGPYIIRLRLKDGRSSSKKFILAR